MKRSRKIEEQKVTLNAPGIPQKRQCWKVQTLKLDTRKYSSKEAVGLENMISKMDERRKWENIAIEEDKINS